MRQWLWQQRQPLQEPGRLQAAPGPLPAPDGPRQAKGAACLLLPRVRCQQLLQAMRWSPGKPAAHCTVRTSCGRQMLQHGSPAAGGITRVARVTCSSTSSGLELHLHDPIAMPTIPTAAQAHRQHTSGLDRVCSSRLSAPSNGALSAWPNHCAHAPISLAVAAATSGWLLKCCPPPALAACCAVSFANSSCRQRLVAALSWLTCS
jgi:hypothetical protein